MEQISDLQYQAVFQALGLDVVSIAFDSQNALAQGTKDYGILMVPLVTDPAHKISELYGVLQWAVATEEPGHSFLLVDGNRRTAWIPIVAHRKMRLSCT